MGEYNICGDNRFELIAKYRAKLIDGTKDDGSDLDTSTSDGLSDSTSHESA